jgi:hypothetical protein
MLQTLLSESTIEDVNTGQSASSDEVVVYVGLAALLIIADFWVIPVPLLIFTEARSRPIAERFQ